MSLRTPELRNLLRSFVTSALRCADPDVSQLDISRFRLHNGRPFEVSDEANKAQHQLVRGCVKALGPIKGHAKVIERAVWDLVVTLDDLNKLDDVSVLNNGLDDVEKKSASVCEFFRPCPLVSLPHGRDMARIGDVSIYRTASRIDEFNSISDQFSFTSHDSWAIGVGVDGATGRVSTAFPLLLWSVELAAADPVREEEALWRVDVALSLLRLAVDRDQLGPFAPGIGKVEAHPFFVQNVQDQSFSLKLDRSFQIGGMSAPNVYGLSDIAINKLSDETINNNFKTVFESRPKSVAERFYQGCGWLTRGRRSKDRSDRLLYFFTAMESLLSDSDKTSPIVQTIARHLSVLLSDDNSHRFELAATMRRLYAVRSALVHSGARNTFDTDADTAQYLAESAFSRVWNDCDLKQSHHDFSQMLSKAGYGLPFL